ncbi:MAG: hypothetical protein JXJ17_08510 [Anaerolineae bacterium]|nr:hypothetical protein [Anaerolineae bacterium]
MEKLAKQLSTLELILVIGGIVIMAAGWRLSILLVLNIGLLIVGLGLIVGAAGTIVERRVSFSDSEVGRTDSYSGVGAIAWGVVFGLLGVGIVTLGIVRLIGAGGYVTFCIRERPGIGLILGGLLLAIFGFPSLIGSHEEGGDFLRFWGSVPRRIFGVLIVVVGLAAIALGVIEIARPDVFNGWYAAVKAWFAVPSPY